MKCIAPTLDTTRALPTPERHSLVKIRYSFFLQAILQSGQMATSKFRIFIAKHWENKFHHVLVGSQFFKYKNFVHVLKSTHATSYWVIINGTENLHTHVGNFQKGVTRSMKNE